MAQFGWNNAPAAVRRQATNLVKGLRATLGENLLGVYLHGSLAMGCFNPQRSDLDVLAVTLERLAPNGRPLLARWLLRLSGVPAPIEISVLNRADLHPWQHPAPFDFHYSEDWRDRTLAHLESGAWPEDTLLPRDPDLAAHIQVTLARGLCLWGAPAAAVLPPVPAEDYTDSILADFRWGRELLGINPVYFVLNACRVRAFLEDGRILSKAEGGAWGLEHLAPALRPTISRALRVYRGDAASEDWDKTALEAFAEAMAHEIGVT